MHSTSLAPFSPKSWRLAIVALVLLCAGIVWYATSRSDDASALAPIATPAVSAHGMELARPVADVVERAARAPVEGTTPEVEVVAVPKRTVRGRVLDLERNPVAGLPIGDTGFGELTGIVSAADGTFEVDAARIGGALEAHGSGWATVWVDRTELPRADRPITILVARAGRLAGSVLDQDGRGVKDALVTTSLRSDLRRALSDVLGADAHEFGYAAKADDSGRFDLGEVPLVSGTLTASHEERKSGAIEIPDGARDDLELRLAGSTVVLRGRVVDRELRTVDTGVVVALDRFVTRTQSNGTFALSVTTALLQEDRDYDLVSARSGALPARARIGTRDDVARAADRSFELVLGGAPLSITGHVFDSEGRPVAGTEVSVEEEQVGRFWFELDDWGKASGSIEAIARNDAGSDEARMRRVSALFDGSRPEGVTGDDGSFTISGLQDRRYVVHAVADLLMTRRRIEDVAAGTHDLRIELDTRSPLRRVAGHVVDSGGRPIAGARVRVLTRLENEQQNMNSPTVETDAHGAFAFERVRGDIVDVSASLPSHGIEMTPKPGVPLDDLTLVLPRRCAIQIDARAQPTLATRFEVHDARSGRIGLSTTESVVRQGWGGGRGTSASTRPIFDGLSDVVTVTEGELTAVLFREKVEVARIPIDLAAEGLTVIRP